MHFQPSWQRAPATATESYNFCIKASIQYNDSWHIRNTEIKNMGCDLKYKCYMLCETDEQATINRNAGTLMHAHVCVVSGLGRTKPSTARPDTIWALRHPNVFYRSELAVRQQGLLRDLRDISGVEQAYESRIFCCACIRVLRMEV